MWQRLAILLTALSLIAGCRQNPQLDAYLELMNAERRGLEERIVDLEADLAQARRELERCEQGGRGNQGSGRQAKSRRDSEPAEDPELVPPTIEIPQGGEEPEMLPGSPALQPPQTEQGEPYTPTGYAQPFARASRRQPPALLPSAAREAISLANRQPGVTQLRVSPADSPSDSPEAVEQTTPADLFILVEPRDAAGRFQPIAGDLRVTASIVNQQDVQRTEPIAVWEMNREEVAQALDSQEGLQAIHLHLPWPTNRPAASEPVQIDVRFTTTEGRRLAARTTWNRAGGATTIAPVAPQPAQSTAVPRWTPRTNSGRLEASSPANRGEVAPASRTTSSAPSTPSTNSLPER